MPSAEVPDMMPATRRVRGFLWASCEPTLADDDAVPPKRAKTARSGPGVGEDGAPGFILATSMGLLRREFMRCRL